MNLINLTPHAVVIMDPETLQHIRTIEPCGAVARVSAQTVEDGTIDGLQVVRTAYGGVEGLPAPEPGVAYIVSAMVGTRVIGRDDVYGPDSNRAIRDVAGRILGVPGLVRF